eukprot:scaffold224943_cov30-Tisochrysis_lutea.AAC.1
MVELPPLAPPLPSALCALLPLCIRAAGALTVKNWRSRPKVILRLFRGGYSRHAILSIPGLNGPRAWRDY